MKYQKEGIWIGFYAVTHALVAFTLASSQHSGDVRLYYRFARDTLHSVLNFSPFSGGFAIEYPPLTALFVTLPLFPAKLFNGEIEFSTWLLWFKLFYLSIDLLTLVLVLRVLATFKLPPRQYWAALVSLTVVSLLLMTLYFDRLDLLLGVLIFIAVLSARQSSLWPWFWLAVGVCFKVIPVLLGPVFLMFLVAQQQSQQQSRHHCSIPKAAYQQGVRAALLSLGWCALLIAPFYLLWGNDLFAFLGYHSERGVQLESIYSNLILLAHHAVGLAAQVRFDFGSFNNVSPWSDALLAWSSVLVMLALAGSYGMATVTLWRDAGRAVLSQPEVQLQRLSALVCLVLIAAMLSAKVFSPQYLLWLFPVYLWIGFGSRPAWLFQISWLLVCGLTTLIYPLSYERDFIQVGLAVQQDGNSVWPAPTLLATTLLTGRNALLLVALIALVRLLWQPPVSTANTSPGQ